MSQKQSETCLVCVCVCKKHYAFGYVAWLSVILLFFLSSTLYSRSQIVELTDDAHPLSTTQQCFSMGT